MDKWYGPKKVEKPREQTIIIGTTDKIADLDPANSYDFHSWEILSNINEGLLKYKPGTTELIPGLAESMPEVSEDGLEYTFKLRPGLKFSDGSPITAETVKYSIDRVMKLEGDPSWLVTSFVDHVEVVDELTVKFVLKNPVAFFPALVATVPYFPVSEKTYPPDSFNSFPEEIVSSGKYMVTSWTKDVEVDLEANPNYYGDPPEAKSVVVRYFADATTMRLALENGEIDVAWKTLNPADIEDLRANPNLQIIEVPGAYIRYICFNVTTPPFDNPKVRQAIAAAIDRNAIVEKVFLGTVAPLYSMVPMGMWSHIDAFKDAYGEHNIEKAKELLAEAGFTEDNPLEMDLWWTPTHYGDTEADVAAVLKEALEETGVIKVNLQSAEWATYIDYMGEGSMPVFLLGWYPDYIDPDDYLSPFASTDGSADMGIFYSNPKMDELLEKAQTTVDLKERTKLYEEIQKLYAEEIPTIPMFQGKLIIGAQKNVKGIVLDPTILFRYYLVYKE
ncbi:MAG: peptide ABC transporter substrate-binding protein [Chloroflexi bacterium]|nr:MAG: peptide ABC transporter substrate-binding protein [Chloroflexota bacterium]